MKTAVVSKGEGLQEKKLAVSAMCVIRIGDVCTIDYPSHHDPESYRFHLACDGQSARVVKIHADHDGVDLELLTGSAQGRVVKKITPAILFFSGPFIKAD
jgi:hypothetical protein